ncbi:MAG TPA: hypothetical protein VGN00_16495 [Puia sp.]
MAQGIRVTDNLLYGNDLVDLYPEVDHGPYLVDNNVFFSGTMSATGRKAAPSHITFLVA